MAPLIQQNKKILFVAALKDELLPIKKTINLFQFPNLDFDFLISGVGKRKSIFRLSNYIEKNKPDFVLNIGTCGSIQNKFALGTIFIPEAFIVMIDNNIKKIEIDLRKYFPEPNKYSSGKIFSSTKPVKEKEHKIKIIKHTNASAVDMESFWMLEFCKKNKIEFLSIKVVSDFAENFTFAEFKEQLKKIAVLFEKPVIQVLEMVSNE